MAADVGRGGLSPGRVGDAVQLWARLTPGQPAVADSDGVWTYADLAQTIDDTRAWLTAAGLRGGHRLLLVAENCRPLVALFFAAAACGACPVIVSPRLSERELAQISGHCRPYLSIFVATASPQARAHAARAGLRSMPTPHLGALFVPPADLNADADADECDSEGGWPLATLVYTSGTTGTPKAVMLTHRNLLFMAHASGQVRGLHPADCFYGVLPMSHIVGLSVVMLGTLVHGATLLLAPRFTPGAMLAALAHGRVSILLGAPAMFSLLAGAVPGGRLDISGRPRLRLIGACGAPLDAASKTTAERLFGLTLHNGYGITECSPTIAQTRPESPVADCSVGPPLPGVELRLLGPDNAPVGEGEIGELHVRGPNVAAGYYRAPEETRAVFDPQGWFNTRDLARLHAGGLTIVGRTKELIIRSGHNVFPPEIEAVLNAHPTVAHSAVIGVARAGDEDVLAFVQAAPGAALSTAELGRHLAVHLAAHKRPSRIFAVDALPIGPNGKVIKAELARLVPHVSARTA